MTAKTNMEIDIKKIAQLARLEIPQGKENKFKHDFVVILDYFNKLKEVDVAKVAPMLSVIAKNKNVYREDEVDEKGKSEKEKIREEFLVQAPQRKDNHLKVKAILK